MQPCRLVTAQTAVTLQCPGDRLAMEITEMECGVIREKRETLMSKEIYEQIVCYIEADENEKKSFSRNIEKRVKHHQYRLMEFPLFDKKKALFSAKKAVKVKFLSFA